MRNRYFAFFAIAFIGTWWIVLVGMSYCVFFEMRTRGSRVEWLVVDGEGSIK